jgi:hypothetical protein
MRASGKLFVFLGLAVFLFSCRYSVNEGQPSPGKISRRTYFRPLKDYKLKLEPVSPERTFFRGGRPVMRFRLTNEGVEPLVVYEWKMDGPENIRIYYRRWEKRIKKFVESEWSKQPEKKSEFRRSPLTLNKNNSVLIDKELSFVRYIPLAEIPPGGRKYIILPVLNLESVKVRCKPFTIVIK